MRGKKKFSLLVIAFLFFIPGNAAGAIFDLSAVNLETNSTFETSFSNVTDLFNSFESSSLESLLSGYTETSRATASINFRGLPITISYPTSGTTLTLDIPATGLDISFTGANRNASQDKLLEWFEGNGAAELTKLMRALAANTGNDPIAGNPNSIMATTVNHDFATAMNNSSQAEEGTGGFGFGFDYVSLDQQGLTNEKFTLPLSYTFRLKSTPKTAISLRLPIAYSTVDGAKSFSAGGGLAVTFPAKKNWFLTPSLMYGLGGSIDLGSAAHLVSGSLTSSYSLPSANGRVIYTLGNMIGYYSTLKLTIGEFTIDPDISNTVIRNGLMAQIPTEKIAKNSFLQLFILDTEYFGDKLFINRYNEFGTAFGKLIKVFGSKKTIKLGITYLTSSESKGMSANFGYSF